MLRQEVVARSVRVMCAALGTAGMAHGQGVPDVLVSDVESIGAIAATATRDGQLRSDNTEAYYSGALGGGFGANLAWPSGPSPVGEFAIGGEVRAMHSFIGPNPTQSLSYKANSSAFVSTNAQQMSATSQSGVTSYFEISQDVRVVISGSLDMRRFSIDQLASGDASSFVLVESMFGSTSHIPLLDVSADSLTGDLIEFEIDTILRVDDTEFYRVALGSTSFVSAPGGGVEADVEVGANLKVEFYSIPAPASALLSPVVLLATRRRRAE